jgi:RHS repeat-associated protein
VVGGAVARSYTYGLDLISQRQASGVSFYGYDGHSSVRFLTDATGNVTDRYDYDAFGILLGSTETTANVYLYSGEQYDSDLGLQYLRARYMRAETGRFWGMDSYEGSAREPRSLHKYLYVNANPINAVDPKGHDGLTLNLPGTSISTAILSVLALISGLIFANILDNTTSHLLESRAISTADLPPPRNKPRKGFPFPPFFDKARADALAEVAAAKREHGCGSVLYHYTGRYKAINIWFTGALYATPAISHDGQTYPSGAYATDIEPWQPDMTQAELVKTLFLLEDQRGGANVSTVVALCNDHTPQFTLTGDPKYRQFVKEAQARTWVDIDILTIFDNPMP